jgi:Phage tail lysozyme
VAVRAATIAPALAVAGALTVALQGHDGAAADPARYATAASGVPVGAGARQPAPRLFPVGKRPGSAHHHAGAPKPASHSPRAATLSCTGTTGMLPANYATIVGFLLRHGYTKMAAAGVAGNIYQESKGNPESVGTGGGGLIGWTPLPSGFVTGNPAADLHTQLEALMTYNDQWSGYLPALNAATSPADAAYIYMTDFERPGLPVAQNRAAAAQAVATACGF